jgi:hypothetical protein
LRKNRIAFLLRTAGALLLAGLLFAAGRTEEASGLTAPAGDAAGIPEIILQVNDTIVSAYDNRYYLSVYLTNTLQQVAGIEMTVYAGRSGLVRLPDTAVSSAVDMAGSAIAGWDYIQARALSPYTFRIAAVADFPGGSSPAPLPVSSGIPHLLCRIVLEREASVALLDTLHDRTVSWIVAASQTSFSDPAGNTIGLQESTICLNPPVCDSLDTVSYFDPAVNIYVNGAVTFAPNCIRGDMNGDRAVSASDIIALVNHIFKGGPPPPCSGTAGDVNCSGNLTAGDIIYLVNYVYKGGAAPCSG